jgi:pantoate--beta-alanine ligase
MRVVATDKNLREAIGNLDYSRCGFVPTMGALHEGHLALIRRARELASAVVVSVFVNPTQFGPGEDYTRYPRTLDADVAAAEKAGADIVFAPQVETVYPEGTRGGGGQECAATALPAVATQPGLEDRHRPGHFAGVCQVVARLFDLVRPQIAVFGEKDYQQLLVIKAMTAENQQRWPNLQIVAHPTLRDADGLAMSSRNRYLSPQQRTRALAISRALRSANGASTAPEAEAAMHETLRGADLKIDYAAVRDAETLMPLTPQSHAARALIAARLDKVRLIDNESVAIGTSP